MPKITANGLSIEYDERGDANAPPVLLIMGLGGQLTLWPDKFRDMLAAQGFRVIRYDNRDVGLSQKFDGAPIPEVSAIVQGLMNGKPVPVPYLLSDMAADAIGVLDALGIGKAHIVGASMGGMIAQLVAALHPDRALSLTSIMSTSGRPGLPPGKPEALAKLLTRPAGTDRASIIDHAVVVANAVGSPGYPIPDEILRAFAERSYDRSYYPEGLARQYAAIVASGSREALLPGIKARTLVLHGSEDPLLPPEHARDTASLIPGAWLEIIDGWGHNIPPQLNERLTGLIAAHARNA